MEAKKAKLEEAPLEGFAAVEAALAYLQKQTDVKPLIGIICGSGLGGLADMIENAVSVDYKNIPHFPISTVPGHAGKLVFGTLGGTPVVAMKGRLHAYEGYPFSRIAIPVRTLCKLGIKFMFVTNAAGGLEEEYKVGDLMLLKDHLNFPGFACINPLVGPHDDRYGARFVSMSQPYELKLRNLAKSVLKEMGLEKYLREGIYAMVGGPTYESPAEARFIKGAGATAVGMSTVPEVIVAVQSGVRVLAMSLITNKVILKNDDDAVIDHSHVLACANERQEDVQQFALKICQKIRETEDL